MNSQEYYAAFTASVLKMLQSTAIACPHLSICLIQYWCQMFSNIISGLIRKNDDSSYLIQFNVNRETFLKFAEALVLGFKRISVTKSFEIIQIKVIIQCMVRVLKLKSDIIDFDEQYNEGMFQNGLLDDYIYCCYMMFWVCVSCIQSA